MSGVGRFLDMLGFTQPPYRSGAQAGGITSMPALGERAVGVTNGSVTTIDLTGDVFKQPPDPGGNAAGNDFTGWVQIEFDADGDDIMIQCGAHAAALTPSFAANSGANPANVGRVIYNSTGTGQPRTRIWFPAGNAPSSLHKADTLFAISRAGAATLRYRVVSSIPGSR